MRKFCFILIVLYSILFPLSLQAKETTYTVEEIAIEGSVHALIETTDYKKARATFQKHFQNANNIQLREDQKVLDVKYGMVILPSSSQCDMNFEYTSAFGNGYTNGCYGIDAAYIQTTDQNEIQFQISEVIATAPRDSLTLQAIEFSKSPSIYEVKNQQLYHHIKSQMETDVFSNTIALGEAPKSLKDHTFYYSYDGHYFYEKDALYQGFHRMIDDLRKQTHDHAYNANDPYYNYYQFLSHRSYSNYNKEDMRSYFEKQLFIQSPLTYYRRVFTSASGAMTQSLLFHQEDAFFQNQFQFGTNAFMMLSLAMNESATGRSYLAFSRNNLFGHAAFDSDVENNASKYHKAGSSVYSHSYYYLHKSYLNPSSYTYHGGWFGNKASGMNVSYASDPYWGEKAAQYYRIMDDALGKKDYQGYGLGLITRKEIEVKPSLSQEDTKKISLPQPLFVVSILEELDSSYKILLEQTTSDTYHPNDHIYFISKDQIQAIVSSIKQKQTLFHRITFDANEGNFFNNQTSLELHVPNNEIPNVEPPQKHNHIFVGWNKELQPATTDETYIAQYEQVKEARIKQPLKQTYQKDELLDVRNASIEIITNARTLEIPITTEMIANFQTDEVGTHEIQIHYDGVILPYTIQVEDYKIMAYDELLTAIQPFLTDQIKTIGTSQKQALTPIFDALYQNTYFQLSTNQLRQLDALKQQMFESFHVKIEHFSTPLEISNLSLQIPNTYEENQYVKVTAIDLISRKNKKRMEEIANAYGYESVQEFQIQVSYDNQSLPLKYPISITLPKPSEQANMQYAIFHIENDDIIQLPTSTNQSTITFSTTTTGEFLIVEKSTSNQYQTPNQIENNVPMKTQDYKILLFVVIFLFCIPLICSIYLKKCIK